MASTRPTTLSIARLALVALVVLGVVFIIVVSNGLSSTHTRRSNNPC